MAASEGGPPPAVLAGIARRHGLAPADLRLLPAQGAANHTYGLGAELVVRVARPGHEADLAAEAAVLPAAAAAGLPVPALLEHHPGGPGAPAHLVEQRCDGVRLDAEGLDDGVRRAGHRDLGRVLRVLHRADLEIPGAASGAVRSDPDADPGRILADLVADGWIGPPDARWLHAWFDHLDTWRPPASRPAHPVVVHGDASGANALVDPGTGRVLALLDWGDTARADPASDLAKVLPVHLPDAVAGYASTSSTGSCTGPPDEQQVLEWGARALWHHLAWALGRLATAPRPGDPTWSAPPAARVLGILRLACSGPDATWAQLLTTPGAGGRPPRWSR